jgi:hypothetical protein
MASAQGPDAAINPKHDQSLTLVLDAIVRN